MNWNSGARDNQNYTLIIRPDDIGTFVAYVLALDRCHAWGEHWVRLVLN